MTTTTHRINATQARAWMNEYPEAIILDVRTADEFNAGHIQGALLLPVTDIEAQAAALLPDKDALILIYCRSGVRSVTALNHMLAMGYTRVYEFGGIIDWPYGLVLR